MFVKFQLYRSTFLFNSCKQLLSADDRCYEKKFNEIFMYVLKIMCMPNISSLGWFSFSSAVNSWWKLSKFFLWDLHLPPKPDTCAKFQLFRLIFIFISCQQLLTAVDSWWQLSRIFFDGIFIYPLKLIPVPNFSSLGWVSFLSAFDSFWQLMTAVTKKIWMGFSSTP